MALEILHERNKTCRRLVSIDMIVSDALGILLRLICSEQPPRGRSASPPLRRSGVQTGPPTVIKHFRPPLHLHPNVFFRRPLLRLHRLPSVPSTTAQLLRLRPPTPPRLDPPSWFLSALNSVRRIYCLSRRSHI